MEQDNFYIILKNRTYKHENEDNDYHLERIISIDEVYDVCESEIDFTIITDDLKLLSKFIFAINVDELKMLCKIPDYNKKNIRISEHYFNSLNEKVYDYFLKILNNELISANMSWTYPTVYPYDDETIGVSFENYEGWVENKEFIYFKTPDRYKNPQDFTNIFHFENVKKADIKKLQKLINVNILEIGTQADISLNWGIRNGLLKYYDTHSHKRIYISQDLLNQLKEDNELVFEVDTRLDKNNYIEYFITGLLNEDRFGNYNGGIENETRSSYEKYNGAYGFDDNAIDNAFEGDPENYWNID
jgi:hypothetical protein